MKLSVRDFRKILPGRLVILPNISKSAKVGEVADIIHEIPMFLAEYALREEMVDLRLSLPGKGLSRGIGLHYVENERDVPIQHEIARCRCVMLLTIGDDGEEGVDRQCFARLSLQDLTEVTDSRVGVDESVEQQEVE